MRSNGTFIAILLALLAPGLGGCVSAAVGAGATVGVAAMQERGFMGAVEDTEIRTAINSAWFDKNVDLLTDVGLSVVEGRVLLTGKVPTQKMHDDAVQLARHVEGVQEVIDEIKVTTEGDIGNYTRDVWIATQLKARLMFDEDVAAINYSVMTVDGVIYLSGIAKNEAELERVTNHAREIAYVRRVVSYVVMKDDPRRHRS